MTRALSSLEAELVAGFPSWAIHVQPQTGRWLAARREALSLEQLRAGCLMFVAADSAEALASRLRVEEDLIVAAERPR